MARAVELDALPVSSAASAAHQEQMVLRNDNNRDSAGDLRTGAMSADVVADEFEIVEASQQG